MKKLGWILVSTCMIAFSACNNDDDDNGGAPPVVDTEAPSIGFADGRDEFRPRMGEERSASSTHMHLRYKVSDPSGLASVSSRVSGQYNGTVPMNFYMIDITDLYTPVSPAPFNFEIGATELNVDSEGTDLWWAGQDADLIRPEFGDTPILAGPYDFTVDAVDQLGNETGEAERLHKRFYIARPYAPQISVTNFVGDELEGEGGEALVVEGSITKGATVGGDIAFVWARLVAEDLHDDFDSPSALSETVWGTSNRVSPSGTPVPAGDSIDLSVALGGDNAIQLPADHGHYHLIVWAEDEFGNVNRQVLEVHVD